MTLVGPERECGIAQAAQVAHGLTISTPAKLRLLQDGLFELGVGDLAVGHSSCDAECAQESERKEDSSRLHNSSNLRQVKEDRERCLTLCGTALAKHTLRGEPPKALKSARPSLFVR